MEQTNDNIFRTVTEASLEELVEALGEKPKALLERFCNVHGTTTDAIRELTAKQKQATVKRSLPDFPQQEKECGCFQAELSEHKLQLEGIHNTLQDILTVLQRSKPLLALKV
jgi:hypothetical protein